MASSSPFRESGYSSLNPSGNTSDGIFADVSSTPTAQGGNFPSSSRIYSILPGHPLPPSSAPPPLPPAPTPSLPSHQDDQISEIYQSLSIHSSHGTQVMPGKWNDQIFRGLPEMSRTFILIYETRAHCHCPVAPFTELVDKILSMLVHDQCMDGFITWYSYV